VEYSAPLPNKSLPWPEDPSKDRLSTSWSTSDLRELQINTLHGNYRYQLKVVDCQVPPLFNEVSPECAGSELLQQNNEWLKTQREQYVDHLHVVTSKEYACKSYKNGQFYFI